MQFIFQGVQFTHSSLVNLELIRVRDEPVQLNAAFKAEGQAHLVVRHRLRDWLIANSDQLKIDQRTVGKLNALKYELHWVVPTGPELEKLQDRQEFKLDPEIENKLKQSAFAPGGGGLHVLTATTNSGQAYVNECNTDGVPIPPTIGVLDPPGLVARQALQVI